MSFSLVSAGMSGSVCVPRVQCWSKRVMARFYLQMPIQKCYLMLNCSCIYSSVRCCECSASLSHWYYEKDGRLFCKKDYWAKFGELCHGCNDPITTGLIMVSGSICWLSSLITSLVLCLLINLELQLGSGTLTARTSGIWTNLRTCTWDQCQNWHWYLWLIYQIALQTTSESWSCCCDTGEQERLMCRIDVVTAPESKSAIDWASADKCCCIIERTR